MDNLASLILAVFLEKGWKSVLDIGCGYGYYTGLFGINGEATGVDIVPEYLDKAKKAYPHVKFIMADARNEKLPLAQVAFTHGFFIHIPPEELGKTLKNIMKSCKEGLFIESSAKEASPGKMKYDPIKYWRNRGKHKKPEKDLPMKYYYSHDYPKVFNSLGYRYQLVADLDPATMTRMFLVWKK